MLFSNKDIQSTFDVPTLEEAEFLLEQGCVERPDVRREGELITSFVRQAARQPFRVYVRVDAGARKSIKLRGECNCASRRNCAHVAAVLLRALADETRVPDKRDASPPGKRGSPGAGSKGAPLCLLYRLFAAVGYETWIEIDAVTAVRSPGGGFERLKRFHPGLAAQRTPPSFLLSGDLELLSRLGALSTDRHTGRWRLRGRSGEAVLDALLGSKRCFLANAESALHVGRTRATGLQWTIDRQGNQYPQLVASPPAKHVFKLDSQWYLDPSSGDCARLEGPLPQTLIEEIMAFREGLPPGESTTLVEDLVARYPAIEMSGPRRLEVQALQSAHPVPCLYLSTVSAETLMGEVDVALLTFDYGGARISEPMQTQVLGRDKVLTVERNRPLERDCAQLLLDAGLSRTSNPHAAPAVDSFAFAGESQACLEFQARVLPRLRELNWRVELDSGLQHRLAEIQQWFGDLEPLGENDWFGLRLGIQVEGERINLLPALVDLLENLPGELRRDRFGKLCQQPPLIVALPDGRPVALPFERVRNILETLFELYETKALDSDDRLRLGRLQLARLAELDEQDSLAPIRWLGDNELKTLRGRLRSVEKIPETAAPEGFRAVLRDYQMLGLGWLQFLRQNELAGVLADDMGLGKTVQALAHLLLEKQQGRMDLPSLVVAPTSLLGNWRREAERFAPDLRVLTLHGLRRGELFERIPEHDLVLSTYPLLARDQHHLLRHAYHLLILDEAQTIKNPKTQASRLVREVNARHRLCLTGTPLENHLGELWSLFDFLLPGLLGSDKQFRSRIRYPIEKLDNEETAGRLARRLRPFMLRRSKEQVVKELPAKTEILRSVELQGKQRELYEGIRLAMHERVRRAIAENGLERSGIVVLDALLKLRQVCCDPRLVKMESAREVRESAKLEMLMELLSGLIQEGRRVLLFSQFTGMLALIREAVDSAAIPYVTLTGQTRERTVPVDTFQRGEAPLFLISLKAGGLGLNLTAADSVIHYDPWWNPAVERQATDRAHRIGQEKPVFVYKLISEGTVEEKIHALQARKQRLADSLFEKQSGAGGEWTAADLEALFEPLG